MPEGEVDDLLVQGEDVPASDGGVVRIWPTYREVAGRYGVASSLVARYAKRYNVLVRRAAVQNTLREEGIRFHDPASDPPKQPRPNGRPMKADPPGVSFEDLDRDLVFGEVEQLPNGSTITVFSTPEELAKKYGISTTEVRRYSKARDCIRRRKKAQKQILARVDEKFIERRAHVKTITKEKVVEIIDRFIQQFEKDLMNGRVNTTNPTDLNTMVRLREFVLGGADSRGEVAYNLSLERLQERYAKHLESQGELPQELTGVVDTQGVKVEDTVAND